MKLASLVPGSWNQIAEWLRNVDRIRQAACGLVRLIAVPRHVRDARHNLRPRGDSDARADVAPDVVLIQEALGFLLYALTASFQAIAYAFANALETIAHTLETSVRAFREPDYGTLRLGRVGRDGWHLWPQDHGSEYDDGQKEYSHARPYDFEAWIVPGVKACAFGATVPYSVTPVVGVTGRPWRD